MRLQLLIAAQLGHAHRPLGSGLLERGVLIEAQPRLEIGISTREIDLEPACVLGVALGAGELDRVRLVDLVRG